MATVALPVGIEVIERGWLSSNNILLYDGDKATLVDSGYVGHAAQTVELVKSALARRRPGARLTRLVNTHSHSDHLGGNAALKAAFGCAIAIPAGIERMIAEWDEQALLLAPTRQRGERFAHDQCIAADTEITFGGRRWQALAAPGHDMDALMYHCPEERLLISGDALWQDGFGIVFTQLLDDGVHGERGIAATRATLDAIAALAPAIVIPGHGEPFADVAGALERAYKRLAAYEEDVGRMARNAVKACFTFNLLDLGRLREDELPSYLAGVPFFALVNRKAFALSDEAFAEWLLRELLRAGAVEVKDGWILPTMAP